MKFYLAARLSRREEMRGYAAALATLGHIVTATWVYDDTKLTEAAIALRDVNDIDLADGVVLFEEVPRTPTRGGRLVEFGIGVGMGKLLYVIGGHEETVFSSYPKAFVFPHFNDFYQQLDVETRLP